MKASLRRAPESGTKRRCKVNRKLSKHYLKGDNKERALGLLHETGAIEDEYNEELLTEHNRETIERLANSEE